MLSIRRSSLVQALWRMHRWIYRRTGGRLGSRFGRIRILLLTTTGRKTGRPHTTALSYLPDGGHYVVIASNGGAPRHPAWFLNLRAAPRAVVQDRSEQIAIVAREASGEERERLWALIIRMDSIYNVYQRRTKRRIPVVVLEPERSRGIRPALADRAWRVRPEGKHPEREEGRRAAR